MTVPTDWQTKTLGSLLSYEQPTPFLVRSTDYLEFSSVPVLTAGKTFILGYTDEEHGVYVSLPVILFDDFTTACKWVDFPFKVKSSAAKILSGRVGVSDTKFMHEYLSRLTYLPSDHQRHWISVFSSIEALVPPLKEQKAIAEVLSDVDALIDSLEALLLKKRNIKTGVMQELLTGRTRLPGFTADWEIAKFGSICRRRRESGVPTPESFVIELEHMESGSGRLVGESSVQTMSSKRVFQRGDVLFGRLRSYLRKYWLAEREGFCSTEIWALVPENKRVESGFLFQIVRLDEFITATGISYGTHMPRSDWSTIKEWPLSLPPVKEQKAIANVLSDMDDEIEALEKRLAKTRDLKQGMAQELLAGRTRLV
jgi:hypothetical protein